MAVVYDELRRLARRQMADEAGPRTLQPTALVHEAYLRLQAGENVEWANRRHFFFFAAQIMREIRIDDARKRKRLKRGGGERPCELRDDPAIFDDDPAEVLAVDEALERLDAVDPRKAQVVKLRYFAGLSIEECAETLGVSQRSVNGDWYYAKAWLHRELSKGDTKAS
jgi:RNA polymerase sigma factor (TIGR02999 family)